VKAHGNRKTSVLASRVLARAFRNAVGKRETRGEVAQDRGSLRPAPNASFAESSRSGAERY